MKPAKKAKKIIEMREEHRNGIQRLMPGTVKGLELLDFLLHWPFSSITIAANQLGVSYPTASNLFKIFEERELLKEVTGQERNREYRYSPYLTLLDTR